MTVLDETEIAGPNWIQRSRIAGLVLLGLLVLSTPVWGPPALSRLSFFQLRKVELDGLRYLQPADVLARLAVDTTLSVWLELPPLEERVAAHPQVLSVRITRKLPGTLLVRVQENLPLALVPSPAGYQIVDARGEVMPIDPSRTSVDLPIIPASDTTLLRLLASVRDAYPSLFNRISEVRRSGKDELVIQLLTVPVLTGVDVTVQRLADILPVERDLAGRNVRVSELDLRFREQVIARLQ